MLSFLTVLIALVSLLLMAAILVQNPKGGGIDSTFGGVELNKFLVHLNQPTLSKKLLGG